MNTDELLYQAGLSEEWLNTFITESNKIDPQPGDSNPGSLLYDGHREAALYAITTASVNRFAMPDMVHQLLLRDHPLSTKFRNDERELGLQPLMPIERISKAFWEWNFKVRRIVENWRNKKRVLPSIKTCAIWDLHWEFEYVHPYDIFNGKTGRVLMLNHALLMGLDPWFVPYEARDAYFGLIRRKISQLPKPNFEADEDMLLLPELAVGPTCP